VPQTARGQCKAAIKGKTDAAREIREALEGKTPAAIGDGGESMSVMLNVDVVRRKLFGDDE
jgi:hypothetical protein